MRLLADGRRSGQMSSEKEILIRIEHLKKYFPLRNSKKGAAVRAVDDVSLKKLLREKPSVL